MGRFPSLNFKVAVSIAGLYLLVSGSFSATAQSVGISNVAITPNASSILELRSTNKGFLPPRLTSAQRDSIISPATGLMIFNTSTNKLNYYNGSGWSAAADSLAAANYYTISNTNTLGVGIAIPDSTQSFKFKGVNAASNKLSVTDNSGSATIDLDINQGNLSLNSMGDTLGVNKGGTGQTSYTNGQLLVGNATGSLSKANLTAGTGIAITNGSGSISIAGSYSIANTNTSGVGIAIPDSTSAFKFKGVRAASGKVSVSNNSANNTVDVDVNQGSLSLNSIGDTLAANKGGTGQASYSNGQLLIGNSSGTLTKATITAGSGISVTNASGAVTIANNIPVTEAYGLLDTVTSSTSFTSIGAAGLKLTPGAGDYLVFFSGNIENPAKDEFTYFAIFVNGTEVSQSERNVTGFKGGQDFAASTMAYVTNLSSGQTIEVKWKVSTGTGTAHQRQLIVQRVK